MSALPTMYADERAVRAWMDSAVAGSSAIYATGPAIDPHHPVVVAVRQWCDEGRAVTVQKRMDGRLCYMVQRASAPRGRARLRLRIDPEMSERPEGRLLAHLSRLANLGLACPTNAELARGAGLRDAEAVKYAFKLLKAADHVRVLAVDGQARVVEVIATGERTAQPEGQDRLPQAVRA